MSDKRMRPLLGFWVLSILSCASAASAQVSGLETRLDSHPNFERDRNISVMERPRPGYDAIGLRTGNFIFWPKITAAAQFDDNIFATDRGRTSDTIFDLTSEIALNSDWSRHEIEAYARDALHRYADVTSENTNEWALGAKGRLDVRRGTFLDLDVNTQRLTESRTSGSSPANATKPVQYRRSEITASGTKVFNRLRLIGTYEHRRFDFENSRSLDGALIDQSDRDRSTDTFIGRAEYAVSPATSLFVEAARNRRDYRAPANPGDFSRDSDGVELLAGANVEWGKTIRGQVGLGYVKQDYKDAGLGSIKGLGARGNVEWFATQLITVTLSGSRTVEDSGVPGTSGNLATDIRAHADYELRRNVLLSATAQFRKDKYGGAIASGANYDRIDNRMTFEIGGTYLLSRNVGASLFYSHDRRKSTGINAGSDFRANVITASLTLQY